MIKHLACIMDGNRRWAAQHNLSPWYGHKEGVDAAKRVIDFAIERNISYLSLFVFAIQNFKRDKDEISFLFKMLQDNTQALLNEFVKQEVRITFAGDRQLFPQDLVENCLQIERETEHGKKLHLTLLFCYGGQEEIVAAAKTLAQKAVDGELDPSTISIEQFSSILWSASLPEPDLIIRTGNVHRLSNFFLFSSAYSELYFLDCLWPDITQEELQGALDYFNRCKRNFGT